MNGYLYGNNIADPIPVALEIDLDVTERELSLEELRN